MAGMLSRWRDRLLPETDRNDTGHVRWRIWAPFWVLGFGWGYVFRIPEPHDPLMLLLAPLAALGLPWALALWLTRRKPPRT